MSFSRCPKKKNDSRLNIHQSCMVWFKTHKWNIIELFLKPEPEQFMISIIVFLKFKSSKRYRKNYSFQNFFSLQLFTTGFLRWSFIESIMKIFLVIYLKVNSWLEIEREYRNDCSILNKSNRSSICYTKVPIFCMI